MHELSKQISFIGSFQNEKKKKVFMSNSREI